MLKVCSDVTTVIDPFNEGLKTNLGAHWAKSIQRDKLAISPSTKGGSIDPKPGHVTAQDRIQITSGLS